MNPYSEADLAYAAGFIDGEGHISILKHTHSRGRVVAYRLRVGVTNTNKGVVEWFSRCFGGLVHQRRKIPSHYKIRYDCTLYASHACQFLKKIQPYLKIKKERAAIAIRFGERRHLGERTDMEKTMDNADFELFKALNARGRHPQVPQVEVKA